MSSFPSRQSLSNYADISFCINYIYIFLHVNECHYELFIIFRRSFLHVHSKQFEQKDISAHSKIDKKSFHVCIKSEKNNR